MPIERNDGDLIGAIYDCVIDHRNWEHVVRRVAEATNSVSAGLYFRHRMDPARVTVQHNMDQSFIDAYIETYSRMDPLAPVAMTINPGEIRDGTAVTQTDKYKRSAFFNEWAQPQDWIDVVGVGILRAPDAFGLFSLWRSSLAIPLEPRALQLLADLAPHLKRAFDIHVLLAAARERAASIAVATQIAGFAVVLLTEDCRVIFANGRAEELLRRREGLLLERGRLAASTLSATKRLRALARTVSDTALTGRHRGGTIELDRDGGRTPLVAHLIPLRPVNAVAFLEVERPALAIFIVDPASDFAMRVGGFAARFGLTAAEARVLSEIIRGAGLAEAASNLGIAEATARTHASHIFAKTETKRQTELIRRFFETTLP
jgi:DNA-binding CsgD family transcriptional regulator